MCRTGGTSVRRGQKRLPPHDDHREKTTQIGSIASALVGCRLVLAVTLCRTRAVARGFFTR
jgi:hypothetical protein